jgi:hypothetical protein
MWEFSFAKSANLLLRTAPFLLIRLAVYFGAAAAFVVAAGGGAGIGAAIGTLVGSGGRAPGAFWGGIAGLGFIGLMLWWLREYLLFLVRASHLAAMTLALDRKRAAGGAGSLGHALDLVQQRFRTVERLSDVDRLTRAALADMIRIPEFADGLLPPAARSSAGALRALFRLVFGFVADVLIARQFRSAAREPWPRARDALTLFAQNHRPLMRNAAAIAVFTHGTAFMVFLVGLLPAAMIARALPGNLALMMLPLAAIMAWSVKQAVLDPLAVASMLQAYFSTAEGDSPDTDWDVALTRVSEHFREIKARAVATPQGVRKSLVA